ncbi:MAG: hypothetical protein BGP12_06890 [Rhodospirillales bacterium 70-18]|nr:MAG: hypothetical protein BGP12_06890 [Rhodospirillales bacterium 70-18]
MTVDRKFREASLVTGIVTFTNFVLSTNRARAIDEYLRATPNMAREEYDEWIAELRRSCTTRELVVHNRVVLAARSEMAKRLIGTQAFTGTVNYGAIGTGSTAVADTDTVLDTEAARVQVATATQTGDQINVDFYFNKASASGTFEEFALFIDGTASADTGLMFNRALTGGWVKSSLEGMTVSVQINFSAV